MSKIQIVTDSVANLSPDEIDQYDIKIIPLSVLVDGQSYVDDGVSLAKEYFHQTLKDAQTLPKTSMPALGNFLDLYDSFEEGTEIISIHVSSALSGTYDGARQAADMSKNSVTVVDSVSADRGQAFQVIEAAKLAQTGASKEEILAKIEQVKANTELYVCVFSLENLVKGGRLSRAKGILSSILNIKVIFEFKDGMLTPMQKGRGAKSIQKFLDETVYPSLDAQKTAQCCVSYVHPTEFIDQVIKKVDSLLPSEKTHYDYTSPIVAIHTGEGAFAVIYYKA